MKIRRTKDLKVSVAIGIALLLLISSASVMSLTRTITDSGDTVNTYIRNSNGNYWEFDGTADQVEIQEAIDDLSNESGWVRLPASHLVITNTIYINYSGIELFQTMWRGNDTQRDVGNGLFLADNSDCDMIYVEGRKCHLHDLYLYGNNGQQASGSGIKTASDTSLDIHISHVYLFWCKEYGLELNGGASVIDSVYVEYCDDSGIYVGGNAGYRNAFTNCGSYANLNGYEITKRENRFTNCISADNTENGFYLTIYAYGTMFSACFSQRDGHHGFYLSGAERNIIDGCTIYASSNDHDNTYSAIYLDTPSGTQYSNNNIITDNKIWSDTANEPKYGIAEEDSNQHNNTITGNNIENCVTATILANGDNSTIKDNHGFSYDSLQDDKIWNSNGNYWTWDGDADDVQIQEAMDDAGTGDGGWVKLPPGTYDLEADIDIVSRVDLLGGGMGNTFLVMDGTFGALRYGIKISSGTPHNFSIQDLTIDADEQDFYSCIYLDDATDVLIENVKVSGASMGNFYSEKCTRLTMINVHSTNMCNVGARTPMQAFTFSQHHDSIYNGLYAYDIQEADVIIDWGNCNNCSISNVFVDATGSTAGTRGIKCASLTIPTHNMNFDNINIRGLTCSNSDNNKAFYLLHALVNINVNNLNIDQGMLYIDDDNSGVEYMQNINFNNVNIKSYGNDQTYIYGIQYDYANNITMNNLNVDIEFGYHTWIEGSSNISFTNSNFMGGDLYAKFDDCKYVSIENCRFKDFPYSKTLEFQDSDYWSVDNCEFLYNTGDAVQAGASGGDGCQYFKITNNLFQSNAKGVDTDANVDNYIITDNIFIDDTVDTAPGGSTFIIEQNIGVADQ